jgi:two-component system nitrate/nitrite response regulator NarL
MITVAIIEDNRLVREGMRDMLNELPDVKVVLAATSIEAELLKETNPRVVLLDVGLQDRNSLRLAETVKKEMSDARVIVMALEEVRMTQREREVIALIAVGLSNKEIATRLNIATDTVKSHVRNVMDKLALHSRLQIAAYAHSHDD